MQFFNFVHHVFIDMQTTRCIDNQHISKLDFCLFNCTVNNINWFFRRI
ncbi:Uncharacterised protein [Acinetobacter baumannii]|nr:Uncharacterised protein [Acinetobacter baumannii]